MLFRWVVMMRIVRAALLSTTTLGLIVMAAVLFAAQAPPQALMQSWWSLIAAILFEVAGTTSMKLSVGFSRPLPSVLIVLFYGAAVAALTFALKRIEISIAYAIWSGLGTALIAVIGMVWFREPVTAVRLLSISLIIVGIIGLNLGGARS